MRFQSPLPSRRDLLAAAALAASGAALPAAARAAELPGVQVGTMAGTLRGYQEGSVRVFRGVPYGEPTGGQGRWSPPRPRAPWPGVRDAFVDGEMCPQAIGAPLPEETALLQKAPVGEDCLWLNIFTPATGPGSGRRAVMVWFHGGGMSAGSAGAVSTDGTNLARKQDVVVVTVNHRLNVHGFLHLGDVFGPDYAESGNIGMLDCVAALEWVRDNIEAFGGDPRRVTIFGQSGGAAKVATLMGMPRARGLFHRAIAQSGGATRTGLKENATANARRLLSTLGVRTIEELRATLSERLVEAMSRTRLQFGPIVDGLAVPVDPFDLAGYGLSRDIPMLLGSTATEATFFPTTPTAPISEGQLRRTVQQATRLGDAALTSAIAAFRSAYPARQPHEIAQLMLTQYGIGEAVTVQAERRVSGPQLGWAATWLYHFAVETPVREGRLKSPHTLEIPYVFDSLIRSGAIVGPYTEANQALADRMGAYWANFAKTGDPNGEGLAAWRAYNLLRRPVMVLDQRPRTVDDPLRATRTVVAQRQPRS